MICPCCGKPNRPPGLDGLGTALKPAMELIVLARKPLSEPTIAANVLRWGTGAINIDGCRVEGLKPKERRVSGEPNEGRWPANVLTDGSDEVVEAFPETGASNVRISEDHDEPQSTWTLGRSGITPRGVNDSGGSAARFFYSSKADADDRIGSKHPTVKPLDLMQYLVRLVTPPKGTILDPFAGTGTTGEAAWREGFNAILIEREAEYLADIERRMSLCLAGPAERARESIKARLGDKPQDHGPLFGEAAA